MRFKKLVSGNSNHIAYVVGGSLLLLLLLAAVHVWLCIIPGSFDSDIVMDSIQIIWTDENMQQVHLTDQEQGKKIVGILKHYGRRRIAMRSAEHSRAKGDLEIKGMDRMEKVHRIYLSQDTEEYYLSVGKNRYKISHGKEMYQEMALVLQKADLSTEQIGREKGEDEK